MSLLEILVALIIVGVITSLALPQYYKVVNRFRIDEGKQILYALLKSQTNYYAENEEWASNIADLAIDIPAMENFKDADIYDYDYGNETFVATVTSKNDDYYLYVTNKTNIYCKNITGNPCGQAGLELTPF